MVHVASVASINRYDPPGTENTGASYLTQKVKTVAATYSFARNGAGIVGNNTLDLPYPIPSGAYVTRVFTDPTTTLAGPTLVGLGIEAAEDLVANTAVGGAPWVDTSAHLATLAGGAALVRTTAERTSLIVSQTVAVLSAGEVTIVVEYIEGGDE